jgi:hypothetical protein
MLYCIIRSKPPNVVRYSCRSIHVVSLVHSLIIIVLAVWVSDLPALEQDRAFAWDDRVGFVAAVAAGYIVLSRTQMFHVHLDLIPVERYFVWDTVDAIVNFVDIGFVIHGEYNIYDQASMRSNNRWDLGIGCGLTYILGFVRIR